MSKVPVVILCLALVSSSVALYSSKSDVIQLKGRDFKKKVLKGNGVWLVEFYAPWCGHCKNLAPEWDKAATALKGIVNVAAVDATVEQNLASQYGIQGFPTIKVFGSDKNSPSDYQGERTAKPIVDAGLREAKRVVKARLGGKSSNGSGNRRKSSNQPGGGKNVITLTDSNFDQLVLESPDVWVVEFYAPWCGHCKNFAPELAEAADTLEGEVKVGAVDADNYKQLGSRFGIQGFPTIKIFPGGRKDDSSAGDYTGERTAASLVEAALEEVGRSGSAGTIEQLTSQSTFDESCSGKRICFIAFLPHILDSGAEGRNKYIEMIQNVAKKQRRRPFRFFWSAATDQESMEKQLGLEFGFPAMVAVNQQKKLFATHTGTFDETGINRFAESLSIGRAKTSPLRDPVQVQTVEAWNGSEPEPVEEEFSLEDIMNEEL